MITLAALYTSTPYNLFSKTASNSMVGTDYSNNASGIHTQSSGHITNTTLIFTHIWCALPSKLKKGTNNTGITFICSDR